MECKGESDDLKEATQLYEKVVKEWPHGAYVAEAKQRIEDLKNRETKLMYDEFAKFNPMPAAPESGEPHAKPPAFELPSDKPKTPGDIDFEHKFDGTEKPSPSKGAPEKGTSDKGVKKPDTAAPPLPAAKATSPVGGETKKAEPKKTEPAPDKSKK
jgi:hypothetical protein